MDTVGPHVVFGFSKTVGELIGAWVGHVGAMGDTDDVGGVGETDGNVVGPYVGALDPLDPEMEPGETRAPRVAFANLE